MADKHNDLLPESLNAPYTALLSSKLFFLFSRFKWFWYSTTMYDFYFLRNFLLYNKIPQPFLLGFPISNRPNISSWTSKVIVNIGCLLIYCAVLLHNYWRHAAVAWTHGSRLSQQILMMFLVWCFLVDCCVSINYFMEALWKYFIGSGHEPLRGMCHSSSYSALLPVENTWLQHKIILFILSRTYHASIKGISENIRSWHMPDFQEVFSFKPFSALCELVWHSSKERNKSLKFYSNNSSWSKM